jgi:hypothetical protein
MNEHAESVVSQVLEPGEELLWTGRPELEQPVPRGSRYRKVIAVATIAAVPIFAYWYLPDTFGFRELLQEVDAGTTAMVIGGFTLFAFLLIFLPGPAARLQRYMQSLNYAITNRRLLILEGDKVTDAYPPERLFRPRIRERAPGFADVVFGEQRRDATRDVVVRERAEVAFKGLRNARDVMERIDNWLADHLRKAEAEVAEFLNRRPAGQDSSRGGRRIENRKIGLKLDTPEAWSVKVRYKKRPEGSIGIDLANWQPPDMAGDWNALLLEGPVKCKVEIEVFETEPTLSFEALSESRVADSLAGEVVESERDIAINGVHGFFVTRSRELALDIVTNKAGDAAIVAPERRTVLHDGRRQVHVLSSWPERSSQLRRAVDAVVNSIELE